MNIPNITRAKIAIVGEINSHSWLQECFGTFIFKRVGNKVLPYMRTAEGDLPVTISNFSGPGFWFEVPDWCHSHGLTIHPVTHLEEYHFVTGASPHDSGSSGKIISGIQTVVDLIEQFNLCIKTAA